MAGIERTCLTCKEVYFPKRRDRGLYFCGSLCASKDTRKKYYGFWPKASPEEKLKRVTLNFEKKVIKSEGCWGWRGRLNDKGYAVVPGGSNKALYAHRASWLIYKGEIPDHFIVLHNCDNPICTNPAHLRVGTHKDNAQDKYNRDRDNHAKGEKHIRAKLTEQIVKDIRERLKSFKYGELSKVAREYGMHTSTIWAIKSEKIWRSV